MSHLKGLRLAAIATVMAIVSAGQAFAMPAGAMRVIGQANPPIGHYEFCKTYTSECTASYADAGPMTLSEDKWRTLLDVNYTVNSSITPMTDQEIYGTEERWAYPRTVGDCEDFVLLKRKMLITKGFGPSDLLITVVLQPNGEGHAILTVRTDRGDFVLDNMRNKVMLWTETEYTFLKRQASDNPARWVKLQDGRAMAVGAVSK
jgi:predicted transglutaminase-like cysteine proteinase